MLRVIVIDSYIVVMQYYGHKFFSNVISYKYSYVAQSDIHVYIYIFNLISSDSMYMYTRLHKKYRFFKSFPNAYVRPIILNLISSDSMYNCTCILGYIKNRGNASDIDMQTLSNKLRARAHAKLHMLTNFCRTFSLSN